MTKPLLVLDTNVVLDLLVFRDQRCAALDHALNLEELRWIATRRMRDEFERVLAYPQFVSRMKAMDLATGRLLQQFDARALLVDAPGRAPVLCRDADDQHFIDLAVRFRCTLLSKDAAVLALRKRLLALGVTVAGQWAEG